MAITDYEPRNSIFPQNSESLKNRTERGELRRRVTCRGTYRVLRVEDVRGWRVVDDRHTAEVATEPLQIFDVVSTVEHA